MKKIARTVIPVLLIVMAGLAVYLPAFEASFHLDDGPSIRDNPALRRLDPAPVYRFWPTRFVTYFSLALTFRYAGLNPGPYHAGNVAIHLVSALTVFYLLRRISGRPDPLPALLGALFFLVHPVQTQSVTYIIQRATALAACFYLLTLLFYLKSRHGSQSGYLLSLLFAAGAVLSKEFTVTLPLALILVEFTFPPPRPAGWRSRARRLLPFFLLALVIPALFFLHRDNLYYNDPAGLTRQAYLLTQARVLITYLRLIILPLNQQVDYDYPEISSCGPAEAVICLAVLAGLVLAAVFCYRKWKLRPAGFGIIFFLLALLPESSLFPISDVIVEHRLYLPLFGTAAVWAALSGNRAGFPRTQLLLATAAIVALGGMAYRRNLVWENPVTLWEDNVARAPGRARIRGNLGKAYLDRGRFERAAEEFKRMIELEPTAVGAYNNLAVIYIDHLRDYRMAEKYIGASLALFPDYPAGYLNRGVIHLNNRRLKPAIADFERALALDPTNLLAHYNLAACHTNLADLYRREADALLASARKDEARAKAAEAEEEYEKAKDYLRRGRELWPEEERFPLLLGRIARSRGGEEDGNQ